MSARPIEAQNKKVSLQQQYPQMGVRLFLLLLHAKLASFCDQGLERRKPGAHIIGYTTKRSYQAILLRAHGATTLKLELRSTAQVGFLLTSEPSSQLSPSEEHWRDNTPFQHTPGTFRWTS